MPTRNGSAEWRGDLQGGDGTLKVGDHSYEGPYTFKSRFEEGEGTNPEELIGAAQAACYSMQLGAMLANDGHTPESVNTVAKVHLQFVDEKPTITLIELDDRGQGPRDRRRDVPVDRGGGQGGLPDLPRPRGRPGDHAHRRS